MACSGTSTIASASSSASSSSFDSNTVIHSLNCLSDSNKEVRINGVKEFNTRLLPLINDKGKNNNHPDMIALFHDKILPLLLQRITHETIEYIRIAISKLLYTLCATLHTYDTLYVLQCITPEFYKRLVEKSELAEEIRLIQINTLNTVIQHYNHWSSAVINTTREKSIEQADTDSNNSTDTITAATAEANEKRMIQHLVDIYCTSLKDGYVEIKKSACQGVTLLFTPSSSSSSASAVAPRWRYSREQYHRFFNALQLLLKHQQSNVRVSVLNATYSVVKQLNEISLITEILPSIELLVYDKAMKVRELLVTRVAELITSSSKLPPSSNDITSSSMILSVKSQLISILLYLIGDEQDSIQQSAIERIEMISHIAPVNADTEAVNGVSTVGTPLYTTHANGVTNNIDAANTLQRLPPTISQPFHHRPSLTARLYIQHYRSQLVDTVTAGMNDWNENKQFRSCAAIHAIIVYSESDITTHLHTVLSACSYHALPSSERTETTPIVMKALQSIGCFTSVEAWLSVVLPKLRNAGKANNMSMWLAVTQALIEGCNNTNDLLQHISPLIHLFASDSDYKCSDIPQIRFYVITMLRTILQRAPMLVQGSDSTAVTLAQEMYVTLLQLDIKASPHAVVNDTAEQVEIVRGMNMMRSMNVTGIEFIHVWRTLLKHFNDDTPQPHTKKASASSDLLFRFLHRNIQSLRTHLPDILPTLTLCCNPENPYTKNNSALHASALNTLYLFILQADIAATLDQQTLVVILSKIITPCMTWRIGSAAEAVRLHAVTTLNAILDKHLIQPPALTSTMPTLMPVLLSTIDDDNVDIRVQAMTALMNVLQQSLVIFDNDSAINLYEQLLQRLDDSHDSIRILALQCLVALFTRRIPPHHEFDNDNTHTPKIINCVSIHLDDRNQAVIGATINFLHVLIQYNPSGVIDALTLASKKVSRQHLLNDLISYANGI